MLKRTINIKKQEHLGKNPKNFTVERQNSFENEQNPVKIDDFNSGEERVEEKKRKRREQAEKSKGPRKKKVEKEKVYEAEFWKQLKNVKEESKNITKNVKNNIKIFL